MDKVATDKAATLPQVRQDTVDNVHSPSDLSSQPRTILQLQHTIGNQAVGRILARKSMTRTMQRAVGKVDSNDEGYKRLHYYATTKAHPYTPQVPLINATQKVEVLGWAKEAIEQTNQRAIDIVQNALFILTKEGQEEFVQKYSKGIINLNREDHNSPKIDDESPKVIIQRMNYIIDHLSGILKALKSTPIEFDFLKAGMMQIGNTIGNTIALGDSKAQKMELYANFYMSQDAKQKAVTFIHEMTHILNPDINHNNDKKVWVLNAYIWEDLAHYLSNEAEKLKKEEAEQLEKPKPMSIDKEMDIEEELELQEKNMLQDPLYANILGKYKGLNHGESSTWQFNVRNRTDVLKIVNIAKHVGFIGVDYQLDKEKGEITLVASKPSKR